MANDPSIGDVHVDAHLRAAKDFWAKFVADNRTGAARAGEDLGDRIGKAISDRIGRAVRDGLDGTGVGVQGTKAGSEYGGKFADSLRRRLDIALRGLPTPQIGAATTEAEQRVRDLRNQLDALRSRRIGVDISAADAFADIRRLQTELAQLATRSPDVQVRVDAGTASAQLAAIAAQAQRLGGLNPNINVRTNAARAASDISLLVSAGLAIGPAIVPGAAAAVGAILAIGSAAASVVAGAGVAALAFSGVGNAVKALGDAQRDTAKTGATLASQQKTLAGGADQIRSAEASLANVRANAADALRRSSQQTADARRAELQAERDLADVREREARSQQDLAQQVKANALDQRQAVLDLAEARKRAQSGNEADRLAAEQAELRLENLRLAGQRLATDKARSDKTGVEGSRAVQGALQGVAEAQQRVRDAEHAAVEARRQAAFQIAQASQAVVTAQRGIGAATVAAAATGGAALDRLNDSMAALSPTGQQFARFLFSLKGSVDELNASAEGGILPGAQESIQILLPYFDDLNTFVATTSAKLGELEVRGAKTLTAPFWRQFFGFVANEANPNLDLMFDATLNVAEGIARIALQFAPVQRQVGGGIRGLTEDFVDWSRSLEQNQGFQRFVAFAQAEGPRVVATIGELARAGLHIVEAYAPIGSVVVTELRLLAQVIDAIPIPVITALALGITAYKTASLATVGIQALLNSNLLTGGARMLGYTTATAAATTATSTFRTSIAATSSFVGGPFLAGLSIALGIVGAFAAANAEARNRVDSLRAAAASYAQTLKDGTGPAAAEQARQALAQNAALRDLVRTTEQAGVASADLVKGLNGDRAARDQVVAAINRQIEVEKVAQRQALDNGSDDKREAQAHADRIKQLRELEKAFTAQNASMAESADLTRALAEAGQDTVGALIRLDGALRASNGSLDTYRTGIAALATLSGDAAAESAILADMSARVADANFSAADKVAVFGDILDGLGRSAATSGPTFDGLAATFGNIARSSLDARDKVQLLNRAVEQMYGTAIQQVEADEALARTQSQLSTQLRTSSAGFDLQKAAQRGNTDEVLRNRDALEAALQAARDKYIQDVANGVAEDVARERHAKTVKGILNGIDPTQRQTAAVKGLVEKYGAIPEKKTTDVSTPGLDKAIDDLIEAHAVQIGLAQKPPWTRDQIQSEITFLQNSVNGRTGQSAMRKAAGGIVEGWSPHPTADNIPAMLTAREYVQPVSTVDHYGVAAMEAIRQKRVPRDVIAGYASGGLVGSRWPIEIPPTVAMPADLGRLWQQWQTAVTIPQQGIGTNAGPVGPGPGFLPWPSSPSAQRGDTGVWRSILNLVRSSGIPYAFGNAYRPGDPLWHGSGRGVDFMGYNQDTLAQFFLQRQNQLLELIHLTSKGGYFVTRGRRVANMPTQGPLHRNHLHVAMAEGGLAGDFAQRLGVPTVPLPLHVGTYDSGGDLPPGLTLAYNGTGRPEVVRTERQEAALATQPRALVAIETFNSNAADPHDIAVELDWRMRGLG